MSITGSLSNALSGLTASAKAAEIVSSNVANAMTEGYGRREIQLSSRAQGGAGSGVAVDGVQRMVDQTILRDRRLADAAAAGADRQAAAFDDIADIIGTPDTPGTLAARMSALDGALIEASSRPDLDSRLDAVVTAARDLAQGLGRATDQVQQLRTDADAEIARTVEGLNTALERIAEFNALILRNDGAGQDVSALLDQRQSLVDGISDVVPLRVLPRENGTIALYTMGGATLLDIRPAEIGFAPTATIIADMTQASGALSGLTVNGTPVTTSGDFAPFAGGRLDALFQVRDAILPQAQSRLDAVARDLIDRVASPAVDATLAPGDPGFFTDGGVAFDPLNEVGLAGRIAVNTAVDPAAGGALWRLRDGLAAVAPGPVGAAGTIATMATALAAERLPASGDVTSSARSAAGLFGDLGSQAGRERAAAEDTVGYRAARLDGLRLAELAGGVDTDQEMQKLLLIEQSYAANAQVIRTADELIQLLLGL